MAPSKKVQRPPRRSRIGQRAVDSDWFRDKIATRGLSIRRVAKAINYDYSVLQNILSGKRSWHAVDISVIADILGEPMSEVWRRAGIGLPADAMSETVRIVGSVDDAGSVVAGTSGLASRMAPRPEGSGTSIIAVQSATPSHQVTDGWLYYYVPTDKIEAEAVGRLSVIGDASGKSWVRILWRSTGGRAWALRAFGDGADLTADVAWATPVLWVRC